jgi:hypothetical protein
MSLVYTWASSSLFLGDIKKTARSTIKQRPRYALSFKRGTKHSGLPVSSVRKDNLITQL